MKNLFTLIILALISTNLFAQGLTSPNWTLWDLDGNQHTLYDYLDEGKTVVVNIATTNMNTDGGASHLYFWEGHLNDLYGVHGPFGTDEVRVFILEIDPTTTVADLNGTGPNTLGDWASFSQCPIINKDYMDSIYPFVSSPISYVICPNRTMSSVGWTTVTGIMSVVTQCPEPVEGNEIELSELIQPFGVNMFGSNPIIPEIIISNNGTNAINSLTIKTIVDENVYSEFNWTGALKTFYSDTILLPEITGLSDGDHALEIILENPNNSDDLDTENNSISVDFNTDASKIDAQLIIQADRFPSEVSWELIEDDNVIAGFSDYPNEEFKMVTENIALEEDACYTLKIMDSWGDGMQNELNGFISIVYDGEEFVRIDGNEYTSEMSKDFCFEINAGAAEISAYSNLAVYPNPSKGLVHFNKNITGNLTVINLSGQVVFTQEVFNKNHIDLSKLNHGIYVMNIVNSEVSFNIKVSLVK